MVNGRDLKGVLWSCAMVIRRGSEQGVFVRLSIIWKGHKEGEPGKT